MSEAKSWSVRLTAKQRQMLATLARAQCRKAPDVIRHLIEREFERYQQENGEDEG